MKQPIIAKIPDFNYFGNVDITRGNLDFLIDPPIKHHDDYKWIRDDSRSKSEVIEMLETENKYTKYIMNDMESEQKTIYDELLSNIKEDYDSYPLPHTLSGWESIYYYFTRTLKGKSYPVYCRINQESQEETILVDVNKLAEGKTTFDLSGFKVNSDQKLMSYGIDLKGNEKYALHIFNIETGTEIEHTIPDLTYCSYKWINSDTIYYLQGNEQNRLYQVWKYSIVSKTHDLIYQCDDELYNVSINVSENRDYIFIYASICFCYLFT